MSKIEIKKIVVAMGDTEVEMTTDEARRLMNELKSLFGDRDRIIDRPYPVPTPYPVRPIIIEDPPRPRRDYPWQPWLPGRPYITCDSSREAVRIDMNATEQTT